MNYKRGLISYRIVSFSASCRSIDLLSIDLLINDPFKKMLFLLSDWSLSFWEILSSLVILVIWLLVIRFSSLEIWWRF